MAIMLEILSAVKNYQEAKSNLNRIRKKYANERELLNFYEPSAVRLVVLTKENLDHLLKRIKER